MFKICFGSMKVLRSHLEETPIPIPTRKEQDEVVELVNQLLQDCCEVLFKINKSINGKIEKIYKERNKCKYSLIMENNYDIIHC